MRAQPKGAGLSTEAPSYEGDFFAWTQETARLLRDGRFSEVDAAHLAEEVEDMGKRDRREVDSRVTVLLAHLLKWRYQPERRSGSWKVTITAQRQELDRVLKDSPSLRPRVSSELARTYAAAVERAVDETGSLPDRFPESCPWSALEILDHRFLPDE